jgi:precorrin-2/cobalt-factor-2 C20-methyltransferase
MLVGLGLGPGDPELLTLRAVRLLREADAVFVPGNLAYSLISPYRKAEILEFPMVDDEAVIQASIAANADRIAPIARNGLVIFGLLGDPNFFSTFSRLCEAIAERYPDVECRTEPGISAITACAAAAGISLSGGFTVSDGPEEPDCRILLKIRKPREEAARLRKDGYREFILLERMFMKDKRMYAGDELPETSDYFSILVARR